MIVLQIEHPVPDYSGWKKAFDGDPVNRQQSGVKCHRIYRKTDDPNWVVIELEFEGLAEAETLLGNLRKIWNRVEGKVMMNPQAKILEVVEIKNY